MSTTLERENRYVVIKIKHLSQAQLDILQNWLYDNDISPVECVVVECDWPNYEHVWRTVEQVANGTWSETPTICKICKGTGGVSNYFDGILESSEPCPACVIRKPIARLLTWCGPSHMPIPHNGIAARTYEEFPVGMTGPYWKEHTPLYTSVHTPAAIELLQTLLALHDAKVDTAYAWDTTMEEARTVIENYKKGVY